MEFYIFIITVLFTAALMDLIVGVSNDAINFLNSAVGSKAGSRRTIMVIASLGVLVGTTFSSGIMEVARKGIFNPEFFVFHEVMIIFLAVMITDIILLDLYNTFSLPTSTTVSIVFEILGGAVAIALFKIFGDSSSAYTLADYINTANVIRIVSSILLSICFSFLFGFFIMLITRLVFSFDYDKAFKRYGPIFSGLAMAIIIYFILVKGLKGASFITPEIAQSIKGNMNTILIYIFGGSTLLWYIVATFTKINILRIVVLIGTFALALAFAANDLVNFIGAPMGALESFRLAQAAPQGIAVPDITMEGLKNPVQANTWILMGAGTIMVITLWMSRKARGVTRTGVDLSRQGTGFERFKSTMLARNLVRLGIHIGKIVTAILPGVLHRYANRQLDPNRIPKYENLEEKPSFDLLRAAVNLVVASALVSFGTALQLPLSTTFVTFSVAMATSLADKAWGRESAVYRVTGVLTVIGGWFLTALLAFSTCFIFTWFIYFINMPAILILIVVGIYYYFQSNKLHRRREEELFEEMRKRVELEKTLDPEVLLENDTTDFISAVNDIIQRTISALISNHLNRMKKTLKKQKTVEKHAQRIMQYLVTTEDGTLIRDHSLYMGYLDMSIDTLESITGDTFDYLNNNHPSFSSEENTDLTSLSQHIELVTEYLTNPRNRSNVEALNRIFQTMTEIVRTIRKNELRRVKARTVKVKTGVVFLGTVTKIEFLMKQMSQFLLNEL